MKKKITKGLICGGPTRFEAEAKRGCHQSDMLRHVRQMAMMQERKEARLPNPFLDLAVTGLEAQLKVWQAFQVEGTQFIAKRIRADLEHLRALGHCSEVGAIGECQRNWLRECQADYAEECARLAATTFELCYADLGGLGWFLYPRARQSTLAASGTAN